MAAIDPVHGVVREIGEDDLPQVPRHLARAGSSAGPLSDRWNWRSWRTARTSGRPGGGPCSPPWRCTSSRPSIRARWSMPPASAFSATPVISARCALRRTASQPTPDATSCPRAASSTTAQRWSRSSGRGAATSAAPTLGTAAAETRADAFATALLDVLESWEARAPGPFVRVIDDERLPTEVREAFGQLRVSDREAWLGALPDSAVPTAAATTRHGTAYACGTSHATAAVRALEQAVLAGQVLMHDRADLVPRTWAPALPAPNQAVALPSRAPLTLADLRRAAAARTRRGRG